MRQYRWLLFSILLILCSVAAGILGYKIGKPEEKIRIYPNPPSDFSKLPKLTGKKIEFSQLVGETAYQRVTPFDPKNQSHLALRDVISSAASDCQQHFSAQNSPLHSLRRINEASRFFEDRLLTLIDQHPDFSCTIPKTTEGKEQRSGYPDLRIEHLPTQTVAYLDPKLYEEQSRTSSFRTFYYEPTDRTSKITEDALHFLLGFSHDGNAQQWTFTSWNLIDLSSLELTLKAEFHASNRDVYQKDKTIATSQKNKSPNPTPKP